MPAGHQWSVSKVFSRSADLPPTSHSCLLRPTSYRLPPRDQEGHFQNFRIELRDFFSCFLGWCSKPPKFDSGANLAPTWCQNGLKKWAWEGPGRHRKLTFSKKLENLNPTIIYYTSGMSDTSKKHQFRTLNSSKIDEKKRDSKKAAKKQLKYLQVTFFSDFGSQTGSLGGVLELTFLRFFQLWAILGPKGLKELPQGPPDLHFYRFLIVFLTDFDDVWTT